MELTNSQKEFADTMATQISKTIIVAAMKMVSEISQRSRIMSAQIERQAFASAENPEDESEPVYAESGRVHRSIEIMCEDGVITVGQRDDLFRRIEEWKERERCPQPVQGNERHRKEVNGD